MADETTLARRYARALLSVAQEKGTATIDRVETDLDGLAEVWRASADLRTLIAHPSVSPAEKRRALRALLEGRVDPLTIQFLDLLLKKKRLGLIVDIAPEYSRLSDEVQGVATIRVTSFMALSDAQRDKLTAKLRRFTDRPNIQLEEHVDASLLGGLVVRIGDQVLDGSIEGQLRRLHDRLLVREEERAQKAAAQAAEALRG